MNKKNESTELKILDAAKSIFLIKGMTGARMQEIADEAGINKALLHYYFRTKDKLFEAVLKDTVNEAFPAFEGLLKNKSSIEEKLDVFVNEYIKVLKKNPFLPIFLANEINRNPDQVASIFKEKGIRPDLIAKVMAKEFRDKGYNEIDVKQWIVSLLSVLIFPFVAKPMLQKMLFNDDTKLFDDFIEERKLFIKKSMQSIIQTT